MSTTETQMTNDPAELTAEERERAEAALAREENESREARLARIAESERRIAAERAKREREAERAEKLAAALDAARDARKRYRVEAQEHLTAAMFALANVRGAAMREEDADRALDRTHGGDGLLGTRRFATLELQVVVKQLKELGVDVSRELPGVHESIPARLTEIE